jgi:hypothetical protein
MKHLMIDLETMGSIFNAPVLAIGAVMFDPNTGELGDRFYGAIDIADACRHGLPSGETIKWWMGQGDDARKAAVAGTQSAETVFAGFRAFIQKQTADVCPWGNGATFDISILEYAFLKITGDVAPWKFWNVRDCRTIKEIANEAGCSFDGPRAGTHHHALDDAIHQAQWVSHYWRHLTGQAPAIAAPAQTVPAGLEDLL